MKFIYITILLFFCASFVVFPQQIRPENQIDLNGDWEIIFDDKNEGVEGEWHLNRNFEAHEAIRQISVPSCWEEYEQDYEGVAFSDFCRISVFESKDTFWNYTKYPEHDAVVEYIQSVQQAEEIVDFEF